MKRIVSSLLAVALILTACSKHEDERASAANQTQPTMPAFNAPATNAADSTVSTRNYPIRGVGTLRLSVPKDWSDTARRIPEGKELVTAIIFTGTNADDFQVIVEIRYLGEAAVRNFDIRASLTRAGQMEVTNSVEQSLDIQDIAGPEVVGACYSVTDKRWVNTQPTPGEFKYMTEGFARLGGMILKFRVVSNRPSADEKKQALEMLHTARLIKR